MHQFRHSELFEIPKSIKSVSQNEHRVANALVVTSSSELSIFGGVPDRAKRNIAASGKATRNIPENRSVTSIEALSNN